jgi:hypothetical protein
MHGFSSVKKQQLLENVNGDRSVSTLTCGEARILAKSNPTGRTLRALRAVFQWEQYRRERNVISKFPC